MPSPSDLRKRVYAVMDRYGILLSGVLIFAYYLWAAVDLFSSPNPRRGFQGYFFQFSSVLLLWALLYVATRLHEYWKKQKEERENNQRMVQEYARRMVQLEVLDEVTGILHDTVNNPLTIISISASAIRGRFSPDSEILTYIDRIEGALKRVRDVLANIETYQTKKIVKSLQNIPTRVSEEAQASELSVDPEGDIRTA